jgi:hypothetical protein
VGVVGEGVGVVDSEHHFVDVDGGRDVADFVDVDGGRYTLNKFIR